MSVPALGAGGAVIWVLGVAAKAAVVLLLALIGALLMRRASAGVRHLLWSGGILAVLLLPLVSLALPWQLAVLPLPRGVVPAVTAHSDAAPAATEPVGGSAGAAGAVGGRAAEAGRPDSGNGLLHGLFLIWGAGAVFFLGRLALGAVMMRRLVRRATRLETPDWTHPLMEGADRLALDRLPRLLSSDRVAMPVVCGVLDPAIVVPAGAREWSERRRRAVLCHELAHLRRRDVPVNLLARLACALHWFNPLAWLAARGLRVEGERACDDMVLGVGTRPSEYADHLLQIVCGARRGLAPAVAIPMAQRREFEGRMLAILERDASRGAPSGRVAALLAAAGVMLLVPLAAMAPAPATSAPGADVRTTADGAGPRVDARVTQALLQALEGSDAMERRQAASALGTLAPREAAWPLAGHLIRDPDAEVRETAAWALGWIGDPVAIDALCTAALRDPSAKVRATSIWALGQIGDQSPLAKVEAALGDQEAEVRLSAAEAIGRLAPARAPAALLAAVTDRDQHVRETAVWALGEIRDPAAVPALAGALSDTLSKASFEAVYALARIGGTSARQHLTATLPHLSAGSDLRRVVDLALAGQPVPERQRKIRVPYRP
jgi:HEAT repeat protein/beta-lactamase regulating signal transducer with metallopeptidase domain